VRPVLHIADDQERGEIAPEIRALFELGGGGDFAMRGHADLLAKLTQDGLARWLGFLPAAARKPPAWRVAKLHQDDLPVGCERQSVSPERTRAAGEPVQAKQPMGARRQQSDQRVHEPAYALAC